MVAARAIRKALVRPSMRLPIGSAFACPMLMLAFVRPLALAILAVGLATAPVAAEFRTVVMVPLFARARETHAVVTAAIAARPVVAPPPRLCLGALASAEFVPVLARSPVPETSSRADLVPRAARPTVVAVRSPAVPIIAIAARRVIVVAADRTLAFAAGRPGAFTRRTTLLEPF
jgi:hypothetical protein